MKYMIMRMMEMKIPKAVCLIFLFSMSMKLMNGVAVLLGLISAFSGVGSTYGIATSLFSMTIFLLLLAALKIVLKNE